MQQDQKERPPPVAAGTTTITATSGNISGSTTLTVTPATLVSITVTPANPSIVLGTTEQFTATGTYSDNSTQDMTTSVTWSSSAGSVATISNAAGSNGKATSVAAGTTTITATSGNISGSTTLTVTPGGSGANNVLSITVNGSLCSTNSYLNKPCVSVTVCTPGTSTCQTIDDILLDTGSFGLRIFKQVLNVSLEQVTGGSGSLAECVQFGDGSSDWGPVQIASVILGNEPAVQVPIQVIDSTFGTAPSACQNADQSPADAGFNGILGVGLFAQDCGSACSNSARNGMYYCLQRIDLHRNRGASLQSGPEPGGASSPGQQWCDRAASERSCGRVALGQRLPCARDRHPVQQRAFRSDSVYSSTSSGNSSQHLMAIPTAVSLTPARMGCFSPPSGLLPNCQSPDSAWFCPSSTTSLSATNTGASGSPSGVVSFQIGNFDSLIKFVQQCVCRYRGEWSGRVRLGTSVLLRTKYLLWGSKGARPAWATVPTLRIELTRR